MQRSIETPSILHSINLEELIKNLIEDQSIKSKNKKYPREPISYEDFQFAKNIISNPEIYLPTLRADNFCINLADIKPESDISLEKWTKNQYRAFAKLFVKLSDAFASHLNIKQDKKLDITKDAQLLTVKLPLQNDKNRKIVNGINKIILNHGYIDKTGNEEALCTSKWINSKKSDPVTSFYRINYSITFVIVTEKEEVLLLKRKGLSGRAGTWGTLTGKIEKEDGAKEVTLIREVHQEINILLKDKPVHYVGPVITNNLFKDLVEKGKSVSYGDDCSYVYGMIIPEEELKSSIKLDDENSNWKLFNRNELEQFKVHSPEIHGNNFDPNEMHVAAGKALLVLDAAKNNFQHIEQRKINYPYTNSHGFFVHFKNIPTVKDVSYTKTHDKTLSK